MNDLGKFFQDKILSIYNDVQTGLSLMEAIDVDSLGLSRVPEGVGFDQFKLLSEQEVGKLVTRLSKKSCSSDPLPTKIFMQHINLYYLCLHL